MNKIDTMSVNAIRVLSADATGKAKPGIRDFHWEPLQWLMSFGPDI